MTKQRQYRQIGELIDKSGQIACPHTGIDQGCFLFSDNQIHGAAYIFRWFEDKIYTFFDLCYFIVIHDYSFKAPSEIPFTMYF